MATQSNPLFDERKAKLLKLIDAFQSDCDVRRSKFAVQSNTAFLTSLSLTTATTVSAAIVSPQYKALTVILGGLSAISVGVKDRFRFSERHAFYRRAAIECERLRGRLSLGADDERDFKSVWDAYDTLRRNEADIADKADADVKGRVGDPGGKP
jgi:hypothetical protein